MAAGVAAMQQQDVDIDPGWYQGQPETASQPETDSLCPGQVSMPTVLTKLQKWGDYQGYGEPVWPTKLIPMKTPLSTEILDNWHLPSPPRYRLTVQDLLAAQTAAGRRIGLFLDLSNHDCLYAADIPSDVQYLHVQLVAKELPPLEYVHEVGRAAAAHMAAHPDDHIAIHCAYGFNRTGFVVCSYLVEWCGLSVEQALASFAASRPPGVKHEKFRDELRARYGARNQAVPRGVGSAGGGAARGSCGQQCGIEEAAAAGVDAGGGGVSGSSDSSNISSSTAAGISCSSSRCAAAGSRVPPLAQLAAAAAGADVADCGTGQQPLYRSGSSSSGGFSQRPPVPLQHTAFCSSGSRSSPSPAAAAAAAAAGALTPSSSRAAMCSSPLPRLPLRCYSSGSVGDNSSIGCSPDSAADFMLQGSSIQSTISSTMPLVGSQGNTGSVTPYQQQQQQQQQPAQGLWSLRMAGDSSSSNREQAATNAAAAAAHSRASSTQERGLLLCSRSSAGHCAAAAAAAGELQSRPGCSEELHTSAVCCAAGDSEQDDDAAATATEDDADCFQMDDESGEGAGWGPAGSSGHGRSSACECCSAGCCRAATAGGCMQRVPEAAEITGLLAAVQLGHQQQQQQPLCGCVCAATHGSSSSGGGGKHRLAASSSSDGGGVAVGGSRGSSELQNESFGRVTGDDMLRQLREMRKGCEEGS